MHKQSHERALAYSADDGRLVRHQMRKRHDERDREASQYLREKMQRRPMESISTPRPLCHVGSSRFHLGCYLAAGGAGVARAYAGELFLLCAGTSPLSKLLCSPCSGCLDT